MQDVELRLYRVGDIVGDQFVLDEAFDKYNLALDDESLLTLPSTLQSYIRRDEIEAVHVAMTDRFGKLEVGSTPKAVYLVDGSDVKTDKGLYRIVPSLVYVNVDDCVIELKHEFIPITVEKVSKTVEKLWTRNAGEFKQAIVVDLLADGEVYDTFTLDEENGWSKVCSELDSSALWSFVEHEDSLDELPEGYEWNCRVSVNGDTTTITNDVKVSVIVTPPPSPAPSVTPPPVGIVTEEPPVISNPEPDPEPEPEVPIKNNPNTGVNSDFIILVSLLVVCAGVAVVSAIGVKKCNKNV